ncbi:hypothetical protein CARUB_v10024550mg [Capsella rubella]|uniref:F-box domain-containing protein n=1 Tax=Capsella rubella TaxID=81985 RepID=R0HSJ0_9BRAS|nr:hypothetical protein CARUB_v10024550mg [Capsella rubella]
MDSRDFISNLPDEVLGKILSLLWTNRAACTSVLSKRWRNLLELVDNLDLNDASGDHHYFCDFILSELYVCHEASRIDTWIRTVLKRGYLELHLETAHMHYIDTEFFTSKKLVELTICGWFFRRGRLPREGVFFPALKSLSLVSVEFKDDYMYQHFINGCPVLEELFLHYYNPNRSLAWNGVVSSPSIKRLNIYHRLPDQYHEMAEKVCVFQTPNLVYLEYSSYVKEEYEVYLPSLEEARLDIRSWEKLADVYEGQDQDQDQDQYEDHLGDVTDLVAGISNVKTLVLSSDSLKVFHLCCDTIPMFHNLLTLSFESDKDIGWQVVPLLLNNSPNLETLVIKGLVHQVTDMCGDACPCIREREKERVCCLLKCQVKVLNISGYQGTYGELKHMRHFLGNLKCLETVEVGVKLKRKEGNNGDNKYQRITNAFMKLPRISSNCQIQFF